MKNTNVTDKSKELIPILDTHFKGKVNLARIKLIALFICALCKVQTVNFSKLSTAFVSPAQSSSSLRRIQRFISNFSFCPNLIAQLIFSLLPENTDLKLSIDRTNWKFGDFNINIFMLGVVHQGLAFPLLFTMLPKRGNSNSQERINLLNRFIKLFGKDVIDCVLADREFVGDTWMMYLNNQNIPYYIRIRSNFTVFIPDKQEERKAHWLFNHLKINEFTVYHKIVKIGSQLCYISGSKIKGKDGKTDFLILVSYNKPQKAQKEYKFRWQIETCFKAMKSSGFNIEDTHLKEIPRVEKLVLLVMIAFVWAYKTGIYLDDQVKKISIKKHGRRAISIFKYGLQFLANTLLNPLLVSDINICQFLSCT